MVAVAHRILVIIYHMLVKNEDFEELGANFYDERGREKLEKGLVRRLTKLGYEVSLQPAKKVAGDA